MDGASLTLGPSPCVPTPQPPPVVSTPVQTRNYSSPTIARERQSRGRRIQWQGELCLGRVPNHRVQAAFPGLSRSRALCSATPCALCKASRGEQQQELCQKEAASCFSPSPLWTVVGEGNSFFRFTRVGLLPHALSGSPQACCHDLPSRSFFWGGERVGGGARGPAEGEGERKGEKEGGLLFQTPYARDTSTGVVPWPVFLLPSVPRETGRARDACPRREGPSREARARPFFLGPAVEP